MIGYNLLTYMAANSRTSPRRVQAFSLIVLAVLISACVPLSPDLLASEAVTAEPEISAESFLPEVGPTAQPEALPDFSLPDPLTALTPDNIQSIRELASVYPYFSPYYHISNNGSRVAVGDLQKIKIWDAASGDLLSSIPASLPDCDFGFDRYFRLNADGTFIALVNGQSIQVWQVGGGMIYDSPQTSQFTSNAPSCGVDLPELALSPDGRLLAVSGMDYSRTSVKRYFRVVDILANEVLYEWDGTKDTLHGNLYTFYGLGFSDDGRILQTFDPVDFILSEGKVHNAFHFWSVKGWREIKAGSDLIEKSFMAGQLLFPVSNSGEIEIRSKLSGLTVAKIKVDGCQWDFPCETRFSADGKQAVVLNRTGEKIQFKTDGLRTSFSVWDLTENKEIGRESGVFRDLESVMVREDGKLLRSDQMSNGDSDSWGWWTFRDHFTGLQVESDGKATFAPLAAISNSSQECQYCSACTVDSEKGEISCLNGLTDSEGGRMYLETEGERNTLKREQAGSVMDLGKIILSQPADLSKIRVRLLEYSIPQQTLFYCVDENLRQAGCFIYDPYREDINAEQKDISYLRFSADGMTAAFFNRTVNALFLYDLSSKTLTRKYPYQARGYPANPVFSADGSRFMYIIQNLNNASDLSVETLDSKTWKSYGRVSLNKAGVNSPTVFSESSDGAIWAFAGKNGEVWLLSPEKGVLLHSFQAHVDEIIGMVFSPDNKWLLTMGENGILKFWGVE